MALVEVERQQSPLDRPAIAQGVLAAGLAIHFAVLIRFHAFPLADPSPDLSIHFHVLGFLSAVLSMAVFVASRASVFRTLAAIRLFVLIVLAVRFQGDMGVRLLLPITLMLELAVYEPYPLNVRLSAIASVALSGSFYLVPILNARQTGDGGSSIADGPSDLLVEPLTILVIVGLVAVIASLVSRFYEEAVAERAQVARLGGINQELSANNVRLQQLAFRSQEESRERERNRITREIHDAVGYTLTNLVMMMEAATDLVHDDPVRLSRLMQSARDQAKSGLAETRRALRELRAHEDELPHGIAAYERLFRAFEGTSTVTVRAEYGNLPMSFGVGIDAVVYRFVQEGLTNAVRHGRATQILAFFWLDGDRLSVKMSDNGVGAASIDPGIGLTAMKERASDFGGVVTARDTGSGFEVDLQLTVPEKENGQDSSRAG